MRAGRGFALKQLKTSEDSPNPQDEIEDILLVHTFPEGFL
jgi:hypothetical protein